jgi:hypothetical protein
MDCAIALHTCFSLKFSLFETEKNIVNFLENYQYKEFQGFYVCQFILFQIN